MNLNKYGSLILLNFLLMSTPIYSSSNIPEVEILNTKDFGAKGDGLTIDTKAINAAIVACSRSNNSKIIVPPGQYVAGTILLKSNIVIEIEEGADDDSQRTNLIRILSGGIATDRLFLNAGML